MKPECISCIYYICGKCFYTEDFRYLGYSGQCKECKAVKNEGGFNEEKRN